MIKKEIFNSRMNSLKNALFSSYRRTATVLVIAVLTLAIPVTITLLGQQQDIRQRAAPTDPGCPLVEVSDGSTNTCSLGACPDGSSQKFDGSQACRDYKQSIGDPNYASYFCCNTPKPYTTPTPTTPTSTPPPTKTCTSYYGTACDLNGSLPEYSYSVTSSTVKSGSSVTPPYNGGLSCNGKYYDVYTCSDGTYNYRRLSDYDSTCGTGSNWCPVTNTCPIGPISPTITCVGTTVTCTWSGGQNITSWAADIEQQGTITNISCSTRWYPPNGDGSGGNCNASASTRTVKYNNATPGTYHCTVGGSNTNYACNSVIGSSGTCAIQGTYICNTDPTYDLCIAPNNSCSTNTGTRNWRYTTYNGAAGCTSKTETPQPCTASCTYPSTCQSGICTAPTATPTTSTTPDLAIYNTSTNKQLYSAGESITTNIYIKNTQGSAWQGTVTGRLYYNTADGTNLISACLAGKQPPYGSCDSTKMSALFTDTTVSIPANGYYQLKNVPLVPAIAAPGGAWMVYAYINPNATVIEADASSDTPANNGGNNMRGSSYGITTTPTPTTSCYFKSKGDANCDGHINLVDLLIWRDQVLGIVKPGQDADFNSSGGKPNTVDLLIWRDSIVAKIAP